MVRNNLEIENANIIFRNFSGEENEFNRRGNRNFSILLSEENALKLANDGWNVKTYKSNDDAETIYHLSVKVSYAKFPPCVWLITKQKRKTCSALSTLSQVIYISKFLIFTLKPSSIAIRKISIITSSKTKGSQAEREVAQTRTHREKTTAD